MAWVRVYITVLFGYLLSVVTLEILWLLHLYEVFMYYLEIQMNALL